MHLNAVHLNRPMIHFGISLPNQMIIHHAAAHLTLMLMQEQQCPASPEAFGVASLANRTANASFEAIRRAVAWVTIRDG